MLLVTLGFCACGLRGAIDIPKKVVLTRDRLEGDEWIKKEKFTGGRTIVGIVWAVYT